MDIIETTHIRGEDYPRILINLVYLERRSRSELTAEVGPFLLAPGLGPPSAFGGKHSFKKSTCTLARQRSPKLCAWAQKAAFVSLVHIGRAERILVELALSK